MPSSLLAADTGFPQLTGEQSADEKFNLITNYLYMLLEQLRYALSNLGRENFNDAAFDQIAGIITDPISIHLEDVEGHVADLSLTAERLSIRMSDAEGNLSVLQQTASSLSIRISDAEGNLSVLQQTASSLTSRISSAEGNVSLLQQTAASLSSTIQSAQGDISMLQQTAASLTSRISSAEGNVSTLRQTAQSLSTQISSTQGDLSRLTQTVNGFTLEVRNGDTASTIQLKSGSALIASQTIQMSGLVTFTGLAQGATTINGACIKTGLIDAGRLNLTGAITFGDLSTAVQNDIENAIYTANAAQSSIDRWSYSGTTYIDGSRIMTGTVSASTLEGGEIRLLDRSGQPVGLIELSAASSYGGQKVVLRSGAIELNSMAGDVYIRSGSYGTYLQLKDDVFVGNGDLAPHSSGAQSCGTSARRWSEVYTASSDITTSDRNRKHDIRYDLSPYDALFGTLRPCAFQYNNGRSGRTHLGLIAQDVEQALEAAGLTSLDFAGFVKSPDEETDGGYVYSLRYEEFIPLCIHQIQRLDQRVRALEGSL
ncbi:gp58-like family protein [uncultured Intestinimonas sp.]|uniref:gp58-like family protein n=1 Tax=uncultured Intestinimonas sp. TaxID=1689265 RepID=UPI0025F0A946|nr:gp58-like family protein [uncultured Intestinimonas sp.]